MTTGSRNAVRSPVYVDRKVEILKLGITTDITTAANLKTTDRVFTRGHLAIGDGGEGEWYYTGTTNIGRAGQNRHWADIAYDTKGQEWKRSKKYAFILVLSGQSNAKGSGEAGGGDQTIESGVFTYNPTVPGFETPAWGTNPLPSTLSNNAGIQCANEIYRRTKRPVYLVINAQGGYSIKEWLDDITPGKDDMWLDLTNQLSGGNIDADNTIDLVLWMQGEQDNDAGAAGYNSTGLYKNALNALLIKYQALSAWTRDTKFIASGIGEWNDHPNPDRNDVLHTLDNDEYEFTANISVNGLVRNPDVGQESHFNGDSLVRIGRRFAAKYFAKPPTKSIYAGVLNRQGGQGHIYGIYGNNPNLDLERAWLKGNPIIVTNNSIFTLPDTKPKVFDGSIITFFVTSTAAGRSQIIGNFTYAGIDYSGMLLNKTGAWRFISLNGKIHLFDRPTTSSTSLSFSAGTFTPNAWELDGEVYRTWDCFVNLPVPTTTAGATNLTGMRVSFMAYSITDPLPGTNNGVTRLQCVGGATNKFIDKTGAIVSVLDINVVRGLITLVNINGFWAVEAQNF